MNYKEMKQEETQLFYNIVVGRENGETIYKSTLALRIFQNGYHFANTKEKQKYEDRLEHIYKRAKQYGDDKREPITIVREMVTGKGGYHIERIVGYKKLKNSDMSVMAKNTNFKLKLQNGLSDSQYKDVERLESAGIIDSLKALELKNIIKRSKELAQLIGENKE